jgi:hypothetical protein
MRAVPNDWPSIATLIVVMTFGDVAQTDPFTSKYIGESPMELKVAVIGNGPG